MLFYNSSTSTTTTPTRKEKVSMNHLRDHVTLGKQRSQTFKSGVKKVVTVSSIFAP